jgi:hypothetical protein
MHEVVNREDPGARQRLVILRRGDVVLAQERHERETHALQGEVHVAVGQVHVRQAHVGTMRKIRGRDRARFKGHSKFTIARR